jgi:hypothetical protein
LNRLSPKRTHNHNQQSDNNYNGKDLECRSAINK